MLLAEDFNGHIIQVEICLPHFDYIPCGHWLALRSALIFKDENKLRILSVTSQNILCFEKV